MNRLKRTLSLTLSILLLLSAMCIATTAAYAPQHTEDADILYELGLFKGMGSDANGNPIYGLEQKATRIQGIVLLLHLLGEEADAQAFEGIHPFTDVPDWGSKHVAYAYAKGYTSGTSATTFGSDSPLVGKAYATFVLKALGYDANSDFNYNTALEKAAELGLIQAGECDGELYRDHCVMLSRNALKTNLKDSNQKLVEKLMKDGVVSAEAVAKSSVFDGKVTLYLNGSITNGILCEDMMKLFPDAASIASKGVGGMSFDHISWHSESARRALLAGDRHVSPYIAGEVSTLPTPKPIIPTTIAKVYGGNYTTLITVLDAQYQLIGFTVIPPGYSADHVVFTTCRFGDAEFLATLKNQVKQAAKELKKVDSSAIYRETIKTILADGTEQVESYLRIKEGKIPDGAKYYETSKTNLSIESTVTSDLTSFSPHTYREFGVDQFPLSYSNGKYNNFLLIFDANKNIIAYADIPNKIPVEETIIKISE